MIRAGRMRHVVEVQRPTETRGATGDVTIAWNEVKTVRAAVEPVSGNERFENDQVQSRLSAKIIMRYDPGMSLTTKDRIVYDSRNFQIVSLVNERERDHQIELMVVEDIN